METFHYNGFKDGRDPMLMLKTKEVGTYCLTNGLCPTKWDYVGDTYISFIVVYFSQSDNLIFF